MTQEKTSLKNLIPMIAAIAIPVALQNLLTTTGSMIDTMMLASLGEKTVGAVGLCAQFSSLMFAGYWGFVGGGMLFFSQFWGAGNRDGIRKAYGMTLSFMMVSGLVFGSLACFFPEFVMSIYTDSVPIRRIGVQYLRIVGMAYPLQVIAMAMSSLLRCIEQVRVPLYGGITAVISNCVCNYILIFGKLGMPRLGVRGAAIGTLFSAVINILVIVTIVVIRKIPFILEIKEHFRWNRLLLAEYLRKSFPIICNEVLIGVGNMMINIVLGHQADEAIAATAVFRTLEGVFIAFFSGFSNASSVLVGTEVGAGHHQSAYARAWRIIYLCSGMTGIVCLVLLLIRWPLLHAMGLSGESYGIAVGMLLIFTGAVILRMGNWAQNDTFRAAGDPAYGSMLEILFMFLMVQPAIHIANDVFHAPFLLVFALCYCDEPIRYILMQIHLYSGKWIRPVSEAGIAALDEFRTELKQRRRLRA